MPLLTSSRSAVAAEQIAEQVKADRAILEGMIAYYFNIDTETFPDAVDVALSAQDLRGYLDDLRSAVRGAIERYDTRSTAANYGG